MTVALSIVNAGKAFHRGAERIVVLRDASLEVAAGEAVAVVAARSQGKTTLLHIAAGLLSPDTGEVSVNGVNVYEAPRRRRARLLGGEVAWIGREGPALGLRVSDYLAAPLLMRPRQRRRDVDRAALEALERVGARECASRSWPELSDHQRVRVELARGIASGCSLLLIDDVLCGLGMLDTRQTSALVRQLARESGIAVLMAMSDAEAALAFDRILSLEGGRLRTISSAVSPANVIAFPVERERPAQVRETS